jgi:hypothetical protein
MINFIVSLFLGCSDKETEILEVVEVYEQKESSTNNQAGLDLSKVKTTEEYSKSYDDFEKSIKILRHDKVQVEVFETIKSPMLLDLNEAEKAVLYK